MTAGSRPEILRPVDIYYRLCGLCAADLDRMSEALIDGVANDDEVGGALAWWAEVLRDPTPATLARVQSEIGEEREP